MFCSETIQAQLGRSYGTKIFPDIMQASMIMALHVSLAHQFVHWLLFFFYYKSNQKGLQKTIIFCFT
ncbi:hypothetical protein XELAEV_18015335mg [Xenopus laevis]|uniref:Uncharacterized protein n=1 Tax=Xenopus laevis TaxID=8355 RepID=A0A974DHU1_XENLA|nr:hypothetical protein XELAEV_18015335mg [Xenopus laevis]